MMLVFYCAASRVWKSAPKGNAVTHFEAVRVGYCGELLAFTLREGRTR